MHDVTPAFEAAVWAAVEGRASEEQRSLLEAAPAEHQRLVERLIDDTDDALERARQLKGHERTLVVADFESDLALLESSLDLMTRVEASAAAGLVADPAGEVRLQASWSNGDVVLWAGGPGMPPASNAELSDRIQATGAPANGWTVHPGVRLPGGVHAEAVSIPLADSLGWMVAVGGGLGGEGLGLSVTWLGRVAVAAVRLVAQGRIVPNLRSEGRSEGSTMELNVRWVPALVDEGEVEALAQAMPGPVVALGNAEAKTVTRNVLAAAVDAIVSQAARFLELEAPPPTTRNAVDVAEAVITRLDGSTFAAPVAAGAEVSKRLQRWTKAVTNAGRPTLVVQLDPPDKGDAWFLSVLGTGAEGTLLPVEVALVDGKDTKALGDELARLERIFPALLRAGALRRGQVYLSQDEAWELMTVTGATLQTAGFDVRVPPLSRRKPSAGLRLWTEPTGDSVVGAHQLSNVRWTALFDDVELTAAEVSRLAAEARPLVRSHGRWVELDRADLKEAAVALAERAETTQLTGAEILRHSVGLEGSPLAGGLQVAGSGWATDLLSKAREVSTDPVTSPPGFEGELRSYQAEALAWLGYLDATELGGCLALDMGLGKTPTVLAHLRRTQGDGPALVIVPPRWRATGRRRRPGSPPTSRSSSTTARAGPAPTSSTRPSRASTWSSPPTAPPCATSTRWRRCRGVGWCSTRPRPSRTTPTRRPSSCAASLPAPGSPSPAPRSRTAWATSGRSSTSPTPAWSGPGPPSSPSSRARARSPCGPSTASSCSAAPSPSPRWRPSCPTASTSSTTAP